MSEPTSKERVLQVWPDAYHACSPQNTRIVHHIQSTSDTTQLSGKFSSEALAWNDAASRLEKPAEPICNGPFGDEESCPRITSEAKLGRGRGKSYPPAEPLSVARKSWLEPRSVALGSKEAVEKLAKESEPAEKPDTLPASERARTIITRIVENAIRLQWTRTLSAIEANPDSEEWPTEDAMVEDALALALGDDTGLPERRRVTSRERRNVFWLEDLLKSNAGPTPRSHSRAGCVADSIDRIYAKH